MYSILIFSFLQRWVTRPRQYVQAAPSTTHYQVQLSVSIFSFTVLSTWRLQIHTKMGAQSFGTRSQISNPVFLVFHNSSHCLPTSHEIYSAFVAVWNLLNWFFSALTSQGISSSRLFPSMYLSDGFVNRSAKSFDIQASPRASTFVKNIFATTYGMYYVVCLPPHSRSIYSSTFSWLQCSHSSNSIWSQQHSCCLVQATAPTQSHMRFVILTPLYSFSSTRKTWCESQRTHEMESLRLWGSALRFETVALTYAILGTGPRWVPGPGRARGEGRGTCLFLHKNMRRNRLECRFGAGVWSSRQTERGTLFERLILKGKKKKGHTPRRLWSRTFCPWPNLVQNFEPWRAADH